MKWYYSVKCIAVIQIVFFFKQKTAYEMRISDWSSDVCSSDLRSGKHEAGQQQGKHHAPHGRDQAGHQVSVASIGTGAEVRPATARANGPEVPGNAIAVARSCAGAWGSPGWPGSRGRGARGRGWGRKSGVEGERGSGRVDHGGQLVIDENHKKDTKTERQI